MSAFNDFCIVCDQLISGENLPPKVDKLLYCSEACMMKDTSSAPLAVPPAESSENASSRDDIESLIASPLLVPMDGMVTIPPDGAAEDEYMLMKLELASQAVPRIPATKERKLNSGDHGAVQMQDHVAENNYKLWLSQHH